MEKILFCLRGVRYEAGCRMLVGDANRKILITAQHAEKTAYGSK